MTLIEAADVTYRQDGDDGYVFSFREVDNTKVEVALNGVIVQRTRRSLYLVRGTSA